MLPPSGQCSAARERGPAVVVDAQAAALDGALVARGMESSRLRRKFVLSLVQEPKTSGKNIVDNENERTPDSRVHDAQPAATLAEAPDSTTVRRTLLRLLR